MFFGQLWVIFTIHQWNKAFKAQFKPIKQNLTERVIKLMQKKCFSSQFWVNLTIYQWNKAFKAQFKPIKTNLTDKLIKLIQ